MDQHLQNGRIYLSEREVNLYHLKVLLDIVELKMARVDSTS